ncbi:MAG: gamma-glutamylcyclotransferase [Hyphomicrobiaceae bacterium]|nr:gamma-glutamylcyclotransferase [Hyphomicrobiaceae bacterium]
MWRPGFDYEEMRRATLVGYRRCFCVFSTHHRGSAERPGLVLGLDRGGTCHGLAFRIAAARRAQTLEYLSAREQINGVYRDTLVPVALDGEPRREVLALAYIVERRHPSYAGRLGLARQTRLIRGACGISGPNLDYLINTLAHLDGLGIREPELSRVLSRIGAHFARGRSGDRGSHGAAALLNACRHVPVDAPRLTVGERRRFIYRRQISAWAARSRST